MSASAVVVDKLQDMFPQFSRTTILDVLDQAGDGAMDCLLELCEESKEGSSLGSSWSEESTNSWQSVNDGDSVDQMSSALTDGELDAPRSRGWWSPWPKNGNLPSPREGHAGSVGQKSDARQSSVEGDVSDAWSEDEPSLYSSSVVVTPTPQKSSDGALSEGNVGFGIASSENALTEEKNAGHFVNVAPLADNFVQTKAGWESVAEGPVNVSNWGIFAEEPRGGTTGPATSSTEYWSPDSETSTTSEDDCEPQKRRFLGTMFGDYDFGGDALRDVLASVDGDVDSAVEALLELTKEIDCCPARQNGVEPQVTDAERLEMSQLRVLKEEFPALEDDTLLHVLQITDGDLERAVSIAEGVNGSEVSSGESSADHASSTASNGQRRKKADNTSWTRTPLNSSLHRKARALRRQFGNVPKEEFLVELLRDVGQDVDAATTLLRESGLSQVDAPQSRSSSSFQPTKPKPQAPPNCLAQTRPGATRPVVKDVLQVMPQSLFGMSHEKFQSLYDQQRRKATELGTLKDRSFKQAAEAYGNGHRDLARKLSLQGKEYDRLAQFEHQRAAETIFETRNSGIVNTFAIDLHGMHVDEALESVHQTLTKFKILLDQLPTKKIVRFVTGRGKHSPDNISRLSAALGHFFNKHGIRYSNGQGYFDVSLENANLNRYPK
ncbi:hypothetical protein BSKO_11280 [Bryopsis sp. KO-2023]|nr:hypothetical protein BSKO_11280 [Bryopsis sp. KO-2023]